MKKSAFLFGVVFLISLCTVAQEYKGKFFIGGTMGISQSTRENENESDSYTYTSDYKYFSLNIPVGYFVSNRILIGITPGYLSNNSESESIQDGSQQNRESKDNQFLISPFVRGYKSVTDNIDLFLDLNARFGFGKETTTYTPEASYSSDSEGKSTSYGVGLSPGISVKLHKWLFLDASIGRLSYKYQNYKPDDTSSGDREETTKSFGFNFNYFSFGLSAKIGK